MQKFDRVAGFGLRSALRQPNNLFVACRRQEHVEPEVFEKSVGHREKFMEHQSERHADRLFARYRRWIVTRQQERTGLFVEGNVLLHGWWQSGLFSSAGVESMEAGRAFCRFQSEQRSAVSTADGKTWRDMQTLAEDLTEGGNNAWVVGDATLKNDAVADGFVCYDLVQIVAHDRMAEPGAYIRCRGTACKRCLYGRFDKDGAAFAQSCRGLGFKGEGAEISQRDARARRLFFHKGACAGGADLVHLKIDDLAIAQRNVF